MNKVDCLVEEADAEFAKIEFELAMLKMGTAKGSKMGQIKEEEV